MNGQNVSVPGGDLALAMIDTGTSLIGGPTAAVEAIWGAVPGSEPFGGGAFSFRTFFSSLPSPSAGAVRHLQGVSIYRVRLIGLFYF